jgi:hypothetical protein
MPDQIIQLPADSTGKKIRTQELTVGGNVVQQQYVIPNSIRVVSGVYIAHTGLHSVVASATNGTSTGFWWLYNPVGSAVKVALKRVEYSSGEGAAAATIATAPRAPLLTAFTFTGIPGGAAITPRKADTSFATATALLMSTQVTSVVTLTQALYAFQTGIHCQSTSSGGPSVGLASDWIPPEDGQPILAAGEGIVAYQPDAGTASDPRRFITNIAWEEFTVP